MTTPKPEDMYRTETSPAARRRLQGQVVEAYRERVATYVRYHVGSEHRVEAEQVGAIGVLVALEKFDPDRAANFWSYAYIHVQNEICAWLDRGVYWRPRSRKTRAVASVRGPDADAGYRAAVAQSPRHPADLEDVSVRDETPSAEALLSDAQELALIRRYVDGLDVADRQLLLSPGAHLSCRYWNLIERARRAIFDKDGRRVKNLGALV